MADKKKRHKLTKAQAKAAALRRQRQRRLIWIFSSVAVVATFAVILWVAFSDGGNGAGLATEVEPLREDVETGVTEEGYPYRGAADAPVTIVEFSDYNCSVCRDFNLTTARAVDDELVATGQVKYVLHPFALYPESTPIVEAAACAQEQGGFWPFHHQVFVDGNRFSRSSPPSQALLNEWAQASDLDVDVFETCVEEGRYRDTVAEATRRGQEAFGVNSTPNFFVNGTRTGLLRGEAYIDTLRKAVEAAQADAEE